jgi:DNA-binding NtrC family response regulator
MTLKELHAKHREDMRTLILAAYDEAGGSHTVMLRILGMSKKSRPSLYRTMERLGLHSRVEQGVKYNPETHYKNGMPIV